jgi:inosose dehydratase
MVSIQSYVWHQIYEACGKRLEDHLDETLLSIAQSGIEAFESPVPTAEYAKKLGPALSKSGLRMPSMYAGGTLHTEDWRKSIDEVLVKARMGRELGATIVTVNPNPIAWGKPLDKSDDELKRQGEALQALGEKVAAEGMTLAYHTHDAEMRQGAREFHHMMQATEPSVVGMCLDTHWVYRGAGNSQVAMYDVLKMYGSRLKTLHIRQSIGGVWSEVLGDGDMDYGPLANVLRAMKLEGPIVMEQCFEQGTPRTMEPRETQRLGRQWLKRTFGV